MASSSPPPTSPPTSVPGHPASPARYGTLLRDREFAGLTASFTLTAAATTLSGFALATLVNRQTHSPLWTAISMYGATFATVLGALTLMSIADGRRPRRTLVLLQGASAVGVAAQAVPGLPLVARFGLLLALGFFAALQNATRLGLLAEVVPDSAYALARSLMNIIGGATAMLGYALGALLLRYLSPRGIFVVAAVTAGLALLVVAATVRERSIRPARRPGPRQTWATNVELFSRPGPRAVLLNLWVPNGLVVGCYALLISYDPRHSGVLLAAGPAGMMLGDLVVGRLLTPGQRRRAAFPLRVLLAAPYLLFALGPPAWLAVAAVFLASVGYAATLALQEQLLELTPTQSRGQVQGVDFSGRMLWQGIGAAIAGGVAQHLTPGPATAIAAMAAASLAVTVVSRPFVARARPPSPTGPPAA